MDQNFVDLLYNELKEVKVKTPIDDEDWFHKEVLRKTLIHSKPETEKTNFPWHAFQQATDTVHEGWARVDHAQTQDYTVVAGNWATAANAAYTFIYNNITTGSANNNSIIYNITDLTA